MRNENQLKSELSIETILAGLKETHEV